jgi:hypothetical protein
MYSETNNAIMKTVVETFVIEETQELIYDNEKLDQWNDLVSELGLTGQTQIVKKEKSPIPYLFVNAPMARVFETLCPRKVDIAKYNVTPIPVEILSLAALSKREGHFNKIEIWYDDETPDPFCIGTIGEYRVIDNKWGTAGVFKTHDEAEAFKLEGGHLYNNFNEVGKYLIGRWGDVKMSLDALTAKAKVLFAAKKKDELNQRIKDAQRELEDLEIDTNKAFGHAMPNTDGLPF